MAWTPSLAGFITWFYQNTGIPTDVIPADSPYFGYGYGTAINTVNPQIAQVPGPFFTQAVYNLATDWVINWAPDPSPPVPYPTKNRYNLPYMAFLRKQWNLSGFTPGVVQSTSDVSTAETLVVPKQLEMLTIQQLGNLKTPFGRAYLGIAAAAGTLWGIS
jgi:hypothetical protein